MGRGGGGVSHGGGSRSFSSSHGGSFRSSSSSSHRSSSSSSFSRPSSSSYSRPRPSSSYRPSSYRPAPLPPPRPPRPPVYNHTTIVHHDYGPSYYGNTTSRAVSTAPRRRTSFVRVIAYAIIAVVIIMMISGVLRSRSASGITVSTVDREPLAKQYVTDTGDWIRDDLGWISSQSKVKSGLKYFYDKTGVMPYLVLVESINGSTSPTGQQVWDYGDDIYLETFHDEGHMVFVFQCEDNGDEYTMAAVTGAMAKTVLDDEALEILYDYMDYWFNTDPSQVSEDEMFANTFKNAADRIMVKTPNYTPVYVWCICGVISAGICLVIVKNIIRRKREQAAETERILNTPVEKLYHEDEDLKAKYQSDDEA